MSKAHWNKILAVAGIASALCVGALSAGYAQNPTSILTWAHMGTRGVSDLPGSMGAEASSKDEMQKASRFRITAMRGQRPAQLLLTQYLPPIGNQGAQGSCVAWSTAYYMYTYEVARQLRFTPEQFGSPKFEFSPAYIYNQANGGKNAGLTFTQAFTVLRDHGCATLAEMPYNDKDYTTQPSPEANERAQKFHPRMCGMLFRGQPQGGPAPDLEKLKAYLAELQQPFVLIIPIFSDFPRGRVEPDFVYNVTVPFTKENFKGLHAITIIGYDDNKRAFRMVNSWAERWGDNGFLWLSEDFVKNLGVEAWGCPEPGGPILRSADGTIKVSSHVMLAQAPRTR